VKERLKIANKITVFYLFQKRAFCIMRLLLCIFSELSKSQIKVKNIKHEAE
jgi:hypothetical protein